jgi:TolB protein
MVPHRPKSALTANTFAYYDAAWSPDGRRIAFSNDRDGNREIYVMNADGSEVRRLTNSLGVDFAPSWRPIREPRR